MKYEQGSKAGNTVIYFCNQGFESKKFPDRFITVPAEIVYFSAFIKKKEKKNQGSVILSNKAVHK